MNSKHRAVSAHSSKTSFITWKPRRRPIPPITRTSSNWAGSIRKCNKPPRRTNFTSARWTASDQAVANPKPRYQDLSALAQICAATGNLPKLEPVIKKIITLMPDEPEPRYDLAALEAVLGKNAESLQNLQTALDLNAKRLQANPGASNLLTLAHSDPRFNALRKTAGIPKTRPRAVNSPFSPAAAKRQARPPCRLPGNRLICQP